MPSMSWLFAQLWIKKILNVFDGICSILYKLLQDCSNFHAGSKIRSDLADKKLDVKGVFGVVCRHDVPQFFCDLLHGER